MQFAPILLFLAFLQAQAPHPVPKKPPTARANADLLGLTCAQVLQISSSDWVAKFTATKDFTATSIIRAIDAYGKCYDARTDQLAATLAKSAHSPQARARANFRDLEQALKAFTAKALAASQPPTDSVKTVYAALYEKQFRYEFYEAYAPKPAPTPPAASAIDPAASPATPAAAGSSPRNPTAKAASDNASSDAQASDADPVTQAKNHFGALLNDLPPDRMHELHAAFGQILGPNTATSHMQLLVYRYAIFLIESRGSQPFAPPPF